MRTAFPLCPPGKQLARETNKEEKGRPVPNCWRQHLYVVNRPRLYHWGDLVAMRFGVWTKKGPYTKPNKLRGSCMAGLTHSVTKSNHTGWSDHKFLIAQVMVVSHIPGLIASLARFIFTLSSLCLLFLRIYENLWNVSLTFFSRLLGSTTADTRAQDHQSMRS